MSPWKCSKCRFTKYRIEREEVICGVCQSRYPLDKNIEIMTVSGDSDSEEEEEVRQKSLDQKKVILKGAALQSKLSKMGEEGLDMNANKVMSSGSSEFIQNMAHRSKRAGELKKQIKSRVQELNRRRGYSALVILAATDPISGKKAEGVELRLRDRNNKSPPRVCQGECVETQEDRQTRNRGTQFYFNVKNSQDPNLTPTDTRLRFARVNQSVISPTSRQALDESFETDTLIVTNVSLTPHDSDNLDDLLNIQEEPQIMSNPAHKDDLTSPRGPTIVNEPVQTVPIPTASTCTDSSTPTSSVSHVPVPAFTGSITEKPGNLLTTRPVNPIPNIIPTTRPSMPMQLKPPTVRIAVSPPTVRPAIGRTLPTSANIRLVSVSPIARPTMPPTQAFRPISLSPTTRPAMPTPAAARLVTPSKTVRPAMPIPAAATSYQTAGAAISRPIMPTPEASRLKPPSSTPVRAKVRKLIPPNIKTPATSVSVNSKALKSPMCQTGPSTNFAPIIPQFGSSKQKPKGETL